MAKWRPENWNDIRLSIIPIPRYRKPLNLIKSEEYEKRICLFESGADAMLQILREAGSPVEVDDFGYLLRASLILPPNPTKGVFVFIPDGRNNENHP